MKQAFIAAAILLAGTVGAQAALTDWQNAVATGAPAGYTATNIFTPTTANIGTYNDGTNGGVSYEFIVNASNGPNSSALMGSTNNTTGDKAGLKWEQGTSGKLGLTFFGVADHTSATPLIADTDTQVVFVNDGTDTDIYVNGAYASTIASQSPTLSGVTGIAQAWNHAGAGSGFDVLPGALRGVAVYDSALALAEITTHYNAFTQPGPAVVPSSDPTHVWLFDEGTGSNAADTGTAGGNDGTLQAGATWSTNTAFAYAGNRSVDTSADEVRAPGHTMGSQQTVSMWVYHDTTVTAPPPKYILDSTGDRTLVYLEANPLIYWRGQSLGSAGLSQPTGSGWLHIAMVRDGTNLEVYEDGNLVDVRTVAANDTIPTTWYFGSRMSGNEPWLGLIDEYAFWDTALSADNIKWLSQNSLNALAAPIPEPATMCALGLAVAGLGGYIRKRRN